MHIRAAPAPMPRSDDPGDAETGRYQWYVLAVRLRVCAVCGAVLGLAMLPASADATRASTAGAVVIFEGQGIASQTNTAADAGLASASIRLFWTETWHVPDQPSLPITNTNEVSGKASQKLVPGSAGNSCSGAVTTTKNSYEHWTSFPSHHGDTGLAVPISIGDAAQTCYGGTGWYPFYPGGNDSQAVYNEHVAYAEIPWVYGTPPKTQCIPVRSAYWDDVVHQPGGNTLTETIQWEGRVLIEVDGHQDTTCRAPRPATKANPKPEG